MQGDTIDQLLQIIDACPEIELAALPEDIRAPDVLTEALSLRLIEFGTAVFYWTPGSKSAGVKTGVYLEWKFPDDIAGVFRRDAKSQFRVRLTSAGRVRVAEIRLGNRPPACSGERVSRTRHSEDFTSVNWFGTSYVFKRGQQAESIRCLWAEYERGELTLSEKTIGERVGSSSDRFRLAHVFRKHPAWGRMIKMAEPGVFRLAPPNHQ